MMSSDAAPARPTLTSTASRSAVSANDLILAGMVALNMSVWRGPEKKERISRIFCFLFLFGIGLEVVCKRRCCQ